VCAVPAALLLRGMIAEPEMKSSAAEALFYLAATMFLGVYAVVLFGSLFATTVILAWRFYTHFFSDEGYLTFTLPVKRSTLLRAKLLNEMIFYAANVLLILLCLLIFFWLAPPATEEYPVFNPIVFHSFGKALRMLAPAAGWIVLFLFEGLLCFAALGLFNTCFVDFCFTVGAVIAKKYKLLAGLGIYIGVNAIIGGVGETALVLLSSPVFLGLEVMMRDATPGQNCAVCALALFVVVLLFTGLAVVAHCLTQDKLDRKLNLA
jgi:hypothetical protein